MRFKGVVTKKGPHRGDVVEYSPEEKVRVALGVGITEHEKFQEFLVYPSKIEIKNVRADAKGDLLKKMWQNNSYEATGRIEIARRHKGRDRVLRPQTYEFSIKLEDKLCQNGLPDVKTSELTLEPI